VPSATISFLHLADSMLGMALGVMRLIVVLSG